MTTITADFPYHSGGRKVQVGRPVDKGYAYVSVTEDDRADGGDHVHAVAHLSFERAREVAHALLAEIGEPVDKTTPLPSFLPDPADLPLDYALAVTEAVLRATR